MDFQSFVPYSLHELLMLRWWWPVVFSLLFLFILSVIWSHEQSSRGAIAHWPFLGNLPSLLWNSNRLPEWFTQIFSSLHGRGSFFIQGPMFSNFKYLVTCDPRNLEYILKTNFNNFPKGPDFKQVFDILGDGIFNVDHDLWRVQRKMAHSNFSSTEFKTLASKTSRKIVEEQLIPVLAHVTEQGTIIDFQDVCSRFAYDSNISTILGRSEEYLSIHFPINEMVEANDDAQEVVLYRHAMPIFLWKLLRRLNIGSERKLAKAHKTLDINIQKRITQKREDLHKGLESFDLLSSYINSPQITNDKFLRDAIMSLAAAGKDTIASSLVWFIWLVYKTPKVEIKILEELNKIVISSSIGNTRNKEDNAGKWPLVFESDDLKGLVYLDAAICESLRLYPPLPINSKSVVKEDLLPDGTKVKPGMQILLSLYSVGRMPWIWGEDCLEFKPERWIDNDTGELSRKMMSKFFVFNVGPRTCLGKDLTFTQLKSAIAAIVFNFHVQVVEGHHVCPKPSINLHMKNGLMVNIEKRDHVYV